MGHAFRNALWQSFDSGSGVFMFFDKAYEKFRSPSLNRPQIGVEIALPGFGGWASAFSTWAMGKADASAEIRNVYRVDMQGMGKADIFHVDSNADSHVELWLFCI